MKNKRRKTLAQLMIALAMGCMMMFGMTITASANSITTQAITIEQTGVQYYAGDAVTAAENISKQVSAVAKIIGGIAVVALAILLFTGGGQALQRSKGMAIGILLGVIVLSGGYALFESLTG